MELTIAEKIAAKVIAELKPYCESIQVAGSIRRKRPFVHDIDLVCIPANQGQFAMKLKELGKWKVGGEKCIRVMLPGIDLDVYIATPGNWATLLLIRTGSAHHNVMLCSRAKSLGMKLHADGSGLFKSVVGTMYDPVRVAGDTEEAIFAALNLPYKRPEERE